MNTFRKEFKLVEEIKHKQFICWITNEQSNNAYSITQFTVNDVIVYLHRYIFTDIRMTNTALILVISNCTVSMKYYTTSSVQIPYNIY